MGVLAVHPCLPNRLEGAGVAAGGGEQVFDKPRHPGGSPVDDGDGALAFLSGGVRGGQGRVEVRADDREWAA